MGDCKYIEWELYEKTKNKRVRDCIDREVFSVVLYRNKVWWIETRSYKIWNQLYASIRSEMAKNFPQYKYLYE